MRHWSKIVNAVVPGRDKPDDGGEAELLFPPPSSLLSPVWAYVWERSPVRKGARHLLTTLRSPRSRRKNSPHLMHGGHGNQR
jgi:hypothetical protein